MSGRLIALADALRRRRGTETSRSDRRGSQPEVVHELLATHGVRAIGAVEGKEGAYELCLELDDAVVTIQVKDFKRQWGAISKEIATLQPAAYERFVTSHPDLDHFAVANAQARLGRSSPSNSWSARRLFHASSPLDAERAGKVLDLLSLVVSRRIGQEDIGDALECLHRLACLGCPRWQLWLKTASTVFWVLLNSLREITSAVRGRASAKP
jgi:hypothetical protein